MQTMDDTYHAASSSPSISQIRIELLKYKKPNILRSSWELFITLVAYFICLIAAYQLYAVHFYLCLPIILLGGLLLVRLFVLQHELGHGSLFDNIYVEGVIGSLLSVLTVTPFYYWARCHHIHHATANNLDKQKIGSINFKTVDDYKRLSPLKKLGYRLMFNPWIFLFCGSSFYFILRNRFTTSDVAQHPTTNKIDILSVYYTNILLITYFSLMIAWLGYEFVLIVLLPISFIAAMLGILIFYLQHWFPGVYTVRDKEWNANDSAMLGASYFKLPKVLHWFTANIGYHHIHHLLPKLPFYRLPMVYQQYSELRHSPIIRIQDIPSLFRYKLWDEQQHKLITWKEYSLIS